jgi:hypothetical protein
MLRDNAYIDQNGRWYDCNHSAVQEITTMFLNQGVYDCVKECAKVKDICKVL